MPAASRATTVSTLVPLCKVIDGVFQAVVPVASPLPPRSFDQFTELTPLLSELVPASETVDEVVE